MNERRISAITKRVASSDRSRRTKRTGVACAGVGAVVLAACTGGGSTQSLTMVTYGGDAVKPMAEAYAAPFEKDKGVKVVQDSPTDYSKLQSMQKARNVTWNVVNGDPYMTASKCGELFAPLKGVDRSAIDKRFITDDCSVPANTFSVVLMYDKKKFGDAPPTSWKDFFDTAKYPGKRGLWNSLGGNALEIALLGDGVPQADLYPLDTKRAYKKLSGIKDDVTYYGSLAQSSEMLLNGQVSMVAALNTRAHVASKANPAKVGVSWNQALTTWESWTVPKGAANQKQSMALLNQVASPKAQARLAANYPVGPTATDADLSKVPGPLRSWLPTTPEHLKKSVIVDQKYYAKHYDALNSSYTDFQSN